MIQKRKILISYNFLKNVHNCMLSITSIIPTTPIVIVYNMDKV